MANRPHEAKSRPFGGMRRPWGHVSRHCKYCGEVGPRVQVLGGWAHRRCIPNGSFDDKQTRPERKPKPVYYWDGDGNLRDRRDDQ